MWPAYGVTPLTARINVDLPAPFGPDQRENFAALHIEGIVQDAAGAIQTERF
jgi:hypothetical protein